MPIILLNLGVRMFGQRFARAGIWISIVVLLIVGLGLAKCVYDRTLIANHDAKQDAKAQTNARKASETATAKDTKRQADFRASQDHIKENVDEAHDNGSSPLDAYFGGLRDDGDAKPAK